MKQAVIITYYNADNYGAFLQAYALYKFLSEYGIDVQFRKVNKKDIVSNNRSSFDSLLCMKLEECRKLLPIANNLDYHYDVAIIGSDEVFNFNNTAYKDEYSFDGTGINASKIVSYAASVGSVNKWKYMIKNIGRLLCLKKLDKICVRDDTTETILKLLGIKNITRAVDPTMLVDFDAEIVNPKDTDYVLVYTYGLSDNVANYIKDYAREKGYKIIATGSYCDWADENLTVSPFEWLGLFKNSKYVFTSTFHGTIFSIKYKKQFISTIDKSEKIFSLLREFNLLERMCGSHNLDKFKSLCNSPIAYEKLNVDLKIANSQRYLLELFK